MKNPKLFTGLLAVSLAATPLLPAQDKQLARDVEFVRSLATELRFISLATEQVEALQMSYKDSEDFKLVSQLGIEISLIGAQIHPNREERRRLFRDALEQSKVFIERYEGEPVADAAMLTMVRASYEYGSFLVEELELAREEAPDQIKGLEEAAAQVYRDGVDACESAMEKLEHSREAGSKQEQDYFMCWLYKGMLLRENARAVREDRDHLALVSRDTLEEMIFDMGEDSILGMRAYFEMSQVGEVLGDYKGAVRDYKDTIDSIDKILSNADLEISASAKELLFGLMQQAYDRAANALFLSGNTDEVLSFVLEFREHVASLGAEGADIYDVADHSVLLTEARAMAESGDPAKVGAALDQVREINRRHPNDFIGSKAKSVLKDILDVQSSMVSGVLMLEVAKGDYQAKNYEAAIKGLKRAYAAMSPSERDAKGLELWTIAGRCYGSQQRFLEASLALCDALEKHGQTPGGDAELTADNLERTWNGYLRQSKSDSDVALNPLKDRVTTLLGSYGGTDSEAKLLYNTATRDLQEGRIDQAIQNFGRVPADTPFYEPAKGRLIICYQRKADFAQARRLIGEYESWLETPAAIVPEENSAGRANRGATKATIDYYKFYMDYQEATGANGGDKDPTKFPGIIAGLAEFRTRHAAYAENFMSRVYDIVARLQAELGEVEQAESTYRTLRNEFPGSPLGSMLATVIFTAHQDYMKSVEVEYDALMETEPDRQQTQAATEKLTLARQAALNSGLEYTRNSPQPQYSVMWNSVLIAASLKDWKTVEDLGKKLVEGFGSDEKYRDRVERRVKEKLGEAYLRQGNFKGAVELLAASEEAAIAAGRPNYPVTRLLCLALGGWVEFDSNGTRVIIPGLDKADEAYDKFWTEYKKYALNSSRTQDYDINWYTFHWECYQFANRAIAKDSMFRDRAQVLYNKAEAGENFASLKALGPEGVEVANLFTSYPPK